MRSGNFRHWATGASARLEYVFDGGEQNSPNAVTKEKAAEIAADFMTTFYHIQVGALETQEFRTTPVILSLPSDAFGTVKNSAFKYLACVRSSMSLPNTNSLIACLARAPKGLLFLWCIAEGEPDAQKVLIGHQDL